MVAARNDLPAHAPEPKKKTPTKWKFFLAGGVDQVLLETADDLRHLGELDQKLWVALAMPTKGVEIESRTLELIDTDGDARVRVPEIVAAVKWACETWKDPAALYAGAARVPLAALVDGPALAAARDLLAALGHKDSPDVGLAEVDEANAKNASMALNGDGVVPADSAGEDLVARKLIDEIVQTLGGVPDRSGKTGADKAKLDAFIAAAQAFVAWADEETEDAIAIAEAIGSVRVKLDDWFKRCRAVAFDPRAGALLAGAEADLAALELARLPIAKIDPSAVLDLTTGINPAWEGPIAALRTRCALGPKLAEKDWLALLEKHGPKLAWAERRPPGPVGALGRGRLRTILGSDAEQRVADLIAADASKADVFARVTLVEKTVRFGRDLVHVLRNFVNFSEFYGRKGAAFQAGTLYLDGRSCELCFRVSDPGKHALLASLAATYLAYCDCTRPGGEKMTIAAAFTGGDSDNLMVGRNGVFYDRQGRDWDATVTKIVANPISIREAFFAPYKKFVRLIEEQFAKRAAAADAEANAKMATAAEGVANADRAPPAPAASRKIDIGTVAALGVAIGGIGAMVAGILGAFFGLGMWMPIGFLAVMMMISGPSMALAYLKLRQRNLGPILDANGWAINGRARVNVPFGGVLTDLATLPAGASRSLHDPYAEKRRPWKRWVLLVFVIVMAVSWYLGRLDKLLPGPIQSTRVLGKYAPKSPPIAPPDATPTSSAAAK